MTRVETRLQRLLAVYPKDWQRQHRAELEATVLDLADARALERLPLLWQADLLLGAWRARARADIADRGPLRAGWSLATLLCLVVGSAAGLGWLHEYLAMGMTPMLMSLGGASAVVYTIALTSLPLALAATIAGWSRTARWMAGLAMLCWMLVVFGVELGLANNSFGVGYIDLLAWTALLAVGSARAWSPRPVGWPTGMIALTLIAAGGYQRLAAATAPAAFWGGATLSAGPLRLSYDPTDRALLVAWVVLALGGLTVSMLDPRPAYAAALLLPIVGVVHFAPNLSTAITLGLALALTVGALAVSRRTHPFRSDAG